MNVLNTRKYSWVTINYFVVTWKSMAVTFQKGATLWVSCKLTCPSCWCCEATLLSPENKPGKVDWPSEGFLRCYFNISLSHFGHVSSLYTRQTKAHSLLDKRQILLKPWLTPSLKSYKSFRELWREWSLIGSAYFAVKALPETFTRYGQ